MHADVHELAADERAIGIIESVSRSQFKRRRRAYDELSILSWNDLSQELWLKLLIEQERGRFLSIFVTSDDDFSDYLKSLCCNIAKKGRRKARHGHSIPVSRLTRRDRARIWHGSGDSLEATFDELFERPEYWG